MKEFTVCYTLENDVKHEKIIKKRSVRREEVKREILEKVQKQPYFIAKGDEGFYRINTALIRYIRVSD